MRMDIQEVKHIHPNLDINGKPWSVVRRSGRPWRQKTDIIWSHAVISAFGKRTHGIKRGHFDELIHFSFW